MKRAIFAACAIVAAGTALAQDAGRGRLLYETHCNGCHAERLHAREHSQVHSLQDLRRQVARWTSQAGRPFSESEREDLVRFLDETHYRLLSTTEAPAR